MRFTFKCTTRQWFSSSSHAARFAQACGLLYRRVQLGGVQAYSLCTVVLFKLNETVSCASWGFDVCAALTIQYSDERMSLAVWQTCECSMTCNFCGGCIFLLILLCHAMCGCWMCLFLRYYCLCLEVRFIILKRFILKKEKDS